MDKIQKEMLQEARKRVLTKIHQEKIKPTRYNLTMMLSKELRAMLGIEEKTRKMLEEILGDLTLESGQTAVDFVMSRPIDEQEVLTESILSISKRGWPLNKLNIMAEAREINRKKLDIK